MGFILNLSLFLIVLSFMHGSMGFPSGAGIGVGAIGGPINISVIYETYCDDSAKFIKNQLWPVYKELKVSCIGIACH